MEITYNLDIVPFNSKPKNDAVIKAIRRRLASNTVTTTPEELLTSIEHGHTFTPAKMHGTKGDTWDSQQIIIADIDNDKEDKRIIDNPLNPGEAREIMEAHGIDPFCMYWSFSNTENHPKYRIMVILDEPLTDPTEAQDLTRRFTAIFNDFTAPEKCADTKIIDNARIIYGSKPGSIFYNSGKVTPLSIIRELPANAREYPENVPNVATLNQYAENVRSAENGNYGRFDLIPLLDYIDADDYGVWIKVGIVLKAEGYNVTDWDAWSAKSAKYTPGECYRKWDDLDSNPKGGPNGRITGAYITMLAKQGGYIPPKDRTPKSTPWDGTINSAGEYVEYYTEDPGAIDPYTGTAENAPAPEPVPEPEPNEILEEFLNEIQSERFKPISTGIKSLDEALSGGLERKTLVTLASAPGAGKTAFSQYLFENMARAGHSVIYVNLEMDRSQLLSRSIARIVHERKGRPVKLSSESWEESARRAIEGDVTALTVRRGYNWTAQQRAQIIKALEDYRENIAPRFHYVTANPENIGSITRSLTDILGKLERLTEAFKLNGQPAPLVCIDYLQFVKDDLYTLDPTGKGKKPDTAEAIEEILASFKSFAMKHSTVVFVIMANNRASNKEGRATMDSGRDTSNIEYSGDVMLSLTYTAIEDRWITPELNDDGTEKTDAKGNTKYKAIDLDSINTRKDICADNGTESAIANKLCIKVVKGRSVASRKSARFIFDGAHMAFTEDPEPIEYGKKLSISNETKFKMMNNAR